MVLGVPILKHFRVLQKTWKQSALQSTTESMASDFMAFYLTVYFNQEMVRNQPRNGAKSTKKW